VPPPRSNTATVLLFGEPAASAAVVGSLICADVEGPGDAARVLRGLALGVVEVRGTVMTASVTG
jgi:hypothetical protein